MVVVPMCGPVSDLLATIHRDGGHRELAIGTKEAAKEAILIVTEMRQRLHELEPKKFKKYRDRSQ